MKLQVTVTADDVRRALLEMRETYGRCTCCPVAQAFKRLGHPVFVGPRHYTPMEEETGTPLPEHVQSWINRVDIEADRPTLRATSPTGIQALVDQLRPFPSFEAEVPDAA